MSQFTKTLAAFLLCIGMGQSAQGALNIFMNDLTFVDGQTNTLEIVMNEDANFGDLLDGFTITVSIPTLTEGTLLFSVVQPYDGTNEAGKRDGDNTPGVSVATAQYIFDDAFPSDPAEGFDVGGGAGTSTISASDTIDNSRTADAGFYRLAKFDVTYSAVSATPPTEAVDVLITLAVSGSGSAGFTGQDNSNSAISGGTLTVGAVPEPGTVGVFALAGVSGVFMRRRRAKQS